MDNDIVICSESRDQVEENLESRRYTLERRVRGRETHEGATRQEAKRKTTEKETHGFRERGYAGSWSWRRRCKWQGKMTVQ